jgi:hypothetical protein
MNRKFHYTRVVQFVFLLYSCCACGELHDEEHGTQSSIKTLYAAPSPDGTKKLTLKEHYFTRGHGYTQVVVEFQNTVSGVYAADSTGLGIRTHWVDNSHIVIETKAARRGNQKWTEVTGFGETVKVTYLEK